MASAGAAATVAGAVAPNPDAELLRLCQKHEAANRAYRDATDKQEALPDTDNGEWGRLDGLVTEASLKIGDVEEEIELMPARTPEGPGG